MSNVLSQKEAVYSAVISVLNSNNISFTNGVDNASALMTSSMRESVNTILVNGLSDGSVSFSKTGLSNRQIRAYASGLQSNWLKKDLRLNGGARASTASTSKKGAGASSSSRSSSKNLKMVESDTQIKALKSLLKIKTDPNEISEIEGFINKRVSEITGTPVNL